MARATTNYLNNRDLLAEIHKSKTSYCEFEDPKYSMYDAIIYDLGILTDDEICREQTGLNREDYFKSLKKARIQRLKKEDPNINIDEQDILTSDLVFRYMTYDHIKIDDEWPNDKECKKPSDGFEKVNFPPFQHFILENGIPRCVGLSHYKNGEFNPTAGKTTDKLGKMFILLVEKISKKGNWRNSCVDEATEALTQRGWLKFNEITEHDLILSYSYEDNALKWSKIKSIYRGEFDGLMHKITTKSIDMLITPGHKLLTERGLIKAEYLLESDRIILMGNPENSNKVKKYSDSFVEFVGWLITKGSYEYTDKTRTMLKCIRFAQNSGIKADRIKKCLNELGYVYSEKPNKNECIVFDLCKSSSEEIYKMFPEKNLTMNFITSLTAEQRELLINTMIDGDGWRVGKHKRYNQKNKKHIDLFQALCAISGYRSNVYLRNYSSFGKMGQYYDMNVFSHRKNYTRGECLNFHGGKRNGREHIGRDKEYHLNEPTTYYKGIVWCPQTEYGCFMARRNGTIYLTGNTYLDEMKSSALLQLSQVGLQFDEGRSQIPNPFAFYTTIVNNAFKRVLNIEKRNRDIRDDLIEISGQNPSMTRQVESDMLLNDSNELWNDLSKLKGKK